MKILIKILFIFFIINPIFGQINISANNKLTLKQENLFETFPKKVINQKDFDLALIKISEIYKADENRENLEKKLPILIEPTKNLILWANKNAKIEDQLKCKMFYLSVNTWLLNLKEIIESGNELLNYKENLSKKDVNTVISRLVVGYKRLEAYSEIIKITPLRKKYLIKDNITISNVENDLALAYYNSKNYKLAATSFLKVKEYFRAEGDYLFVSSMSNNVGLSYLKLYDYATAKKYFDLAIKELEKTKGIENKKSPKGYNSFFKAVINSNIAKIDVENGNYEKAIISYKTLINKTLALSDKIEKENITTSYLNISKIYLKLNNIKLATAYLDSTKYSLSKIVTTDNKIEINLQDAKISLVKGEIVKANKFFDYSRKLTDSIAQVQLSRENILAQAKYNNDEKEKELTKAQINIKSNEKSSRIQKLVLLITSILMSVILLFYYKSNKDKKIIKSQKDTLSISLLEKETLLKELHHRVKNNLQVIVGLLQLQSKKVTSAEMSQLLEDSQRHINSMALVHEMLYQQNDYEVVIMKEYLTKLCNQIILNFYDKKITLVVNADNIELPINRAIPIGLMVSELVTNSNKYAFKNNLGTIQLYLNEVSKNNFKFEYKDSGDGLPKNVEEKMKKTMGLRLLQMLSEEINGSISLFNENGFKATLLFTSDEKI